VLFADGGYLNTRERPSLEIDARSRRVAHTGEAGATFALWPKIALRMGGRYVRTIYDADAIFDNTLLAQDLNRTTRALSASLRYSATPLTAFVVTGEVDETRFSLSPIRDSESEKIMGGIDLAPRALVSGSVQLGVQRFRPDHAALPPYEGFIGSAAVRYRLRGATVFGFSFDRALTYSYLELEPYYLRQGFAGSVRHQLIDRWDIDVGAGRSHHQYRLFGAVPRSDLISGERYLDAGASLGYQARPGTRFRVSLTYRGRRSDDDRRSYNGMLLGTSVVYGF
jgi:hypothetical protein